MGINEVLSEKTDKRIAEIKAADIRRAEVHAAVPRIAEIDGIISQMPFRIYTGGDMDSIREETDKLNDERARLLLAHGFAEGYDSPHFECPLCLDSGYTEGLRLCECVKKAAASEKSRKSLIASGLSDKDFDGFELRYYRGEDRKNMENTLEYCRRYAENFPQKNVCGILMTGGTGLGKTHLSAAIANEAAARGVSAVYETAQQIFDVYDGVRFNRIDPSEKEKYERCELLVIDDFGTECRTNYSVSTFSNLLDLRMVRGKQTVISTNLTPQEIKKVYGDRVFSRLLGEFRLLKFSGEDIRMQKIKGNPT